jgi:hypothetical protein
VTEGPRQGSGLQRGQRVVELATEGTEGRRGNFMRFDLRVICVLQNILSHKMFNYFTISRNVLFCLFLKKQGYETNKTFCDTAGLFVCVIFREVVYQKPLFGNRESTAVSLMCHYFAKCSVCRCFSRGCETWKNSAK